MSTTSEVDTIIQAWWDFFEGNGLSHQSDLNIGGGGRQSMVIMVDVVSLSQNPCICGGG